MKTEGDYFIKCEHCDDTGYCWVNFENRNLWMFCSCKTGTNECKRLEQTNYFLAMPNFVKGQSDGQIGIVRLKFPRKSFVPRLQNGDDDKTVSCKINEIVERFRESLIKSARFWSGSE